MQTIARGCVTILGDGPPGPMSNRWLALAVIFVARLSFGFQFQSVASVAPLLVDDLRLSYAGSVKDIQTAVERMKWALDPTSPNEIYIGDRKMVRDWL